MADLVLIREIEEGRSEHWGFTVVDGWATRKLSVVLDFYAEMSRPTRRHKWRSDGRKWVRGERRRFGEYLDSPPDVPIDVAEEALEELRSRVVFAPGVFGWNGKIDVVQP